MKKAAAPIIEMGRTGVDGSSAVLAEKPSTDAKEVDEEGTGAGEWKVSQHEAQSTNGL